MLGQTGSLKSASALFLSAITVLALTDMEPARTGPFACRPPRKARNPRTGKPVEVPGHGVPVFNPSFATAWTVGRTPSWRMDPRRKPASHSWPTRQRSGQPFPQGNHGPGSFVETPPMAWVARRIGELFIDASQRRLMAFPLGIAGGERPPAEGGMGVHMPTLRDSDRGIESGGSLPSTATGSGSASPLRRPWYNRKPVRDKRKRRSVTSELRFRAHGPQLSHVHARIDIDSGRSVVEAPEVVYPWNPQCA